MSRLVTRRRVLAGAALAAPGLVAVGVASTTGLAQQATPEAGPESEPTGPVGESGPPFWAFTVLVFQDPYAGEVTRPEEPEPGTRYVGAEVIITNGSDAPLDFGAADVALRDRDGFQYPAGGVTGSEPRLVAQNLPNGERTRGWVWFSIPEAATPAELRFVGPAPVFRVAIPSA